jgi:hypothetical protein
MPLSREPLFLRMAIRLSGLKRWYLVLGGVAVGRGFKPQSDLELFSAKIINTIVYFGIIKYFEMVLKQHHFIFLNLPVAAKELCSTDCTSYEP